MSGPLVLGIAGSPRRHGNSERLLQAALDGASEAGAQTKLLLAADAALRPCLGCNACSLTGDCVQRDGGSAFYAALDEADALIVSSPVFFATVPATLKVLIDRLQPYWARTYILGRERPVRRPGAILIARSGGDPYGYSAAEATIRSALAVLGVDVLGLVVAEGVDHPADLDERPDSLDEARTLGRRVAEEAARRATDGQPRTG